MPCDGCTACCRSRSSSTSGPTRPTPWPTSRRAAVRRPRPAPGHVLMGYDERGHCPMLVDDRCSIYEHRPRTCRTYDCRVIAAAGVELDADQHRIAERRRAGGSRPRRPTSPPGGRGSRRRRSFAGTAATSRTGPCRATRRSWPSSPSTSRRVRRTANRRSMDARRRPHSAGVWTIQGAISTTVVAVAASKSLTRTRIVELPAAGDRDVGDDVEVAGAERVDDRSQRSRAASVGSVSSTVGVSTGSSGWPDGSSSSRRISLVPARAGATATRRRAGPVRQRQLDGVGGHRDGGGRRRSTPPASGRRARR